MAKSLEIKWVFRFFFVLGLVWVFMVPPFQGPDEGVHFSQSKLWLISFQNGFEDSTKIQSECTNQVYKSFEKHRVGALRFNPLSSYAATTTEKSRRYDYVYDNVCDRLNPTAFYYLSGVPFLLLGELISGSYDVQFYLLRLWSLLIFMGTLYMTHRAARLALPQKESLLLTLLVGLHPIYLFTNVSVSYDNMLNFLFVAGFWINFSFILQKGPFVDKSRFLIGALLVSILALFVKIQGAFLPFFFLLALLISRRFKKRTTLIFLGLIAFTLWLVFEVAFYDLSLGAIRDFILNGLFLEYLSTLTIERWAILFKGFWGTVEWVGIYTPLVFIWFFAILFGLGFLGAIKHIRHDRLMIYAFLCLIFFECVAIIYNLNFLSNGSGKNLKYFGLVQGRHYFPMIFPLFYVLIKGLKVWIPSKHWRSFALVLVFSFLIYHFVYFGGLLIPRFYF